jgi:hypothetical protein
MPSGEVDLLDRAVMRVDEALHPDRSSAGRGLNVGAGRDPGCGRVAAAHEVDVLVWEPARERTAVDPHDRIPPRCKHRQHRRGLMDAEALDRCDTPGVDIEQIRRVCGYEQHQASRPGQRNAMELAGAGRSACDRR